MKGKGKKERDSDEECPLQLQEFDLLEHQRFCPRYTAVLNRGDDESVGLEDLDVLQAELESLLVSSTKRQAVIEDEMEVLTNWQDTSKSKDKKAPVVKAEVSGKRSKSAKEILDEKPAKKMKETSSSSASSVTSSTGKSQSSKPKKNVALKDFDYEQTAQQQYRNDIPDRFCRFIEPYCAPIKQENIKVLEEIIRSGDESDSDIYKVPSLGKHYSLKWLNLDNAWDDKKEAIKEPEKKRGLSAVNSVSDKSRGNRKRKDSKNDAEKGGFGSLTQRLVSCLMENGNGGGDYDDSDGDIGKNDDFLKSINLGNCTQLEKRIKKELEENGMLDDLDEAYLGSNGGVADDDQILRELIKCQSELKTYTMQNQIQLQALLRQVKKDFGKQDLRKKLQTADAEVVEIYRRMQAAKQKKRTPTKKEKDQATKALKDREEILKELDDVPATV